MRLKFKLEPDPDPEPEPCQSDDSGSETLLISNPAPFRNCFLSLSSLMQRRYMYSTTLNPGVINRGIRARRESAAHRLPRQKNWNSLHYIFCRCTLVYTMYCIGGFGPCQVSTSPRTYLLSYSIEVQQTMNVRPLVTDGCVQQARFLVCQNVPPYRYQLMMHTIM